LVVLDWLFGTGFLVVDWLFSTGLGAWCLGGCLETFCLTVGAVLRMGRVGLEPLN
jgi:hypothetical protein